MNTDLDESVLFFKALSDPTRLALLHLLMAACPCQNGLCVMALANRLGVSQPAASQHLRVLRSLDLVSSERQGYRVHYRINAERLRELREMALNALEPDRGSHGADCGCALESTNEGR